MSTQTTVETLSYLAAVKRMIRAAGRRVGDADEFELAELVTLRDDVETAIRTAIDGQRNGPAQRSWAAIADALGVTRQAAFKRYAWMAGPVPEPTDSETREEPVWHGEDGAEWSRVPEPHVQGSDQ